MPWAMPCRILSQPTGFARSTPSGSDHHLRCALILQWDGNLVATDTSRTTSTSRVWASDTDVRGLGGPFTFTVDPNGSGQVYSGSGEVLWSTGVSWDVSEGPFRVLLGSVGGLLLLGGGQCTRSGYLDVG